MTARTVIIADDEPITRIDLAEMLSANSYTIVDSVPTGLDAIEACRKHKPDLVLMDIKMPLLDGIKASQVITSEKLAGCVILLTAYSDDDMVSKAIQAGVTGYIVKPFEEHTLLPALEVSISRENELKKYKEAAQLLNQKMEDRILIEKAKGLIRETHDFSEEEAYSFIRKTAMDKGYKMVTVAKAIIMNSGET